MNNRSRFKSLAVTATATSYRWLLFRNFAHGDCALTKGIEELVDSSFCKEDEPMLIAVQERMAGRDFWEMHPLSFPGDKAAIFARHTIHRLANSCCLL